MGKTKLKNTAQHIFLGSLFFILLFLVLRSDLSAQPTGKNKPKEPAYPNKYCLECHNDQDLTAEDGHSVFTSKAMLDKSVHKGFNCVDCHSQPDADFEDVPHFPGGKEVTCESCHQREGMVYMEYFYKMLEDKGGSDIPDCKECHGLHDAQLQKDMEIVCERCHKEIAKEYKESYHYKKYKEDDRHYPICTTCHDPHFKSKKDVMSPIEYKQETVDICSRCHQKDIEIGRAHV